MRTLLLIFALLLPGTSLAQGAQPINPVKSPRGKGHLIAQAQICNGVANAGAILPQTEVWMYCGYDWMETLTVDSVQTSPGTFSWDQTQVADIPSLFIETEEWFDGLSEGSRILTSEAKWWVLNDGAGAGIEGTGQVIDTKWASRGAHFYSLNLPLPNSGQGNPYYQERGLCNRVGVSILVDMMMDFGGQGDQNLMFSSGQMNDYAYAYAICKDVFPAEVQTEAFEAMFDHWLDYQLTGPNQVNTNIQTQALPAAAQICVTTNDAALCDKGIRMSKKHLFGSETGTFADLNNPDGYFMKGGYIGEARGPETTYFGESHNSLVEAYVHIHDVTGWEFMASLVEKATSWIAGQIFVDPDGNINGPSGYASRTGGNMYGGQKGHTWRYIAAADMHPTHKFYADASLATSLRRPVGSDLTYEQWINSAINAYNSANYDIVNTAAPVAWFHDHWGPAVRYHPADPNWYANLDALVGEYDIAGDNNPIVNPPMAWTDSTFHYLYDQDFSSHRYLMGDTYCGFWTEHVPFEWSYDSWAGGSLQAFFCEGMGLTILSKHDKTGTGWDDGQANHENTRVFEKIEPDWMAHMVWGVDDTGADSAFSSAAWHEIAPAHTDVSLWNNGTGSISSDSVGFASAKGWTTGWFGPDGSDAGNDEDKGWNLPDSGMVKTTFHFESTGLRINRQITSAGVPQIRELWDRIPIYIRDGNQAVSEETQILYDNAGTWTALTTTLTNTSALALVRDFGTPDSTFIVFSAAQDVKLNSAVYQQQYQGNNYIRAVDINLHSTTPGSAAAMPANKTWQYTITPVAP